MDKIIKKHPILITRGKYVFPGFTLKLEIGRKNSLNTIKKGAEEFGYQIVLLSQKNPSEDKPTLNNIYKQGVLANFKIIKDWDDGSKTIEVTAIHRVSVKNLNLENDIYEGVVTKIRLKKIDILSLKEKIENLINQNQNFELKIEIDHTIEKTIDALANNIAQLSIEDKQKIIKSNNIEERLSVILNYTDKQVNSDNIDNKINKKIKDKMTNQQKEFYLREKLRAIKEELGELEGGDDDFKTYLKKLEQHPYPEHIKKRVQKEIGRLEQMHTSSPEYNLIRNYIDTLMSLPWYEKTKDKNDLAYAEKKLNEHHYGLEKVKERIIEYLSVKTLTNKIKGQIICLVGPPGVGKTSLAKSIAEAVGRKFVKVALGGVKDESEIRGHRKTYIGSMPGRIINTMKKAGTTNPLFLLDEIDKMSSDYRGDPASAMLEVLDPEQNKIFSDNYLEEEYDLSDVLFIATANYYYNIPEALIDRMEIIQLSSYTEIEKIQIAIRHLIPNILSQNNLEKKHITFTKTAIKEIIQHYTRETGVRQLERDLNAVTRKFIVKYIKKELKNIKITKENVKDFLGKRRFEHNLKENKSTVGVVTGLAYTQFGGDILPIEVNYFPGKGGLTLTGKLGEVMKESASIALDYIKANCKKFEIDNSIFENNDIHIHVPEGAVPKDGPSAGVTITTAIISALSSKAVSKEIGMTGEITLRGNVLPIGGLKEKSISAHRSGLKHIIIPKRNLKDLEDIPVEVKKDLKISSASKYEDIYKIIFQNNIK